MTCPARPNSACPQTSLQTQYIEHYTHQQGINLVGAIFVITGVMLALLLLIALVYRRYYGKKVRARQYRREYRAQRYKH